MTCVHLSESKIPIANATISVWQSCRARVSPVSVALTAFKAFEAHAAVGRRKGQPGNSRKHRLDHVEGCRVLAQTLQLDKFAKWQVAFGNTSWNSGNATSGIDTWVTTCSRTQLKEWNDKPSELDDVV
jgi:hypothetical protein